MHRPRDTAAPAATVPSVPTVPSVYVIPRPTVAIIGGDSLVQAGIGAFLAGEAQLCPAEGVGGCDVVVAVVDAVDEAAAVLVRSVSERGGQGLLLLAGRLDAQGVAAAVRLGALGVLRRPGLSAAVLTRAVASVARGEAVVPPDLLGQLFGQARQDRHGAVDPPSLSAVRVSDRERAVLRFLADGADTREIARTLRFSERTVKTVIADLTRRFGLRNRAHAVAYALRNGLV